MLPQQAFGFYFDPHRGKNAKKKHNEMELLSINLEIIAKTRIYQHFQQMKVNSCQYKKNRPINKYINTYLTTYIYWG